MKISYLILITFLFIILLFALTTYVNYKQSEQIKTSSQFLDVSTTVVRNSNRFQRNVLNMVSGLRGYLLTGEHYFIESYDSAVSENASILKEISAFMPDTSQQQKKLNEIVLLHNEWINEYATPLAQAKRNSVHSSKHLKHFNALYAEKIKTGNEKKLNIELQEKFREFVNYEYEARDRLRLKLEETASRTKSISFYLTMLSVVGGIVIVAFLTHRIANRFNKMIVLANSIAGGNFNVVVPEKGRDEFSALGQALNHMAIMLRENINELKAKNRELDQFAHIVSHDMKSPLRGIGNVVSWIEEDYKEALPPKVNEYLDVIKGRVVRGENLIEGILSYARIDKENHAKEKVNVKLMVDEIVETLAIKPGLTIDVSSQLPTFSTERIPLYQVFSNLISNAVKYHDKPNGYIKVYHKKQDTFYEFFIEDNGPGISKQYHEKIFQMFQTLRERDSFESTGVGLSIVKKVLDSRKEQIKVISEPNNGSLFSFTWSTINT